MELRVLFLFFASGLSGLIYEVVWVKMFSLTFGSTVYAISTVLAAFMLGLSLGSFAFGIAADRTQRGLKLFAFLEWGTGVSALIVTLLFPALDSAYLYIHRELSLTPEGSTLVRFVAAVLVLLVPTMLMGGTLPALSRCLTHRLQRTGADISRLYGVNTLGACVACFFTGYLLIPTLGVKGSLYLGVGINLLVGSLAFMSRREFNDFVSVSESEPSPKGSDRVKPSKEVAKKRAGNEAIETEGTTEIKTAGLHPLFFSAIAGFCSLSLEVLWTRAFALIYKSTVYLFSNILTVILLGIALGSLAYNRLAGKTDSPLRLFGFIQAGVGCLALLTIMALWHIPPDMGGGGQWIGAASWSGHIFMLFGWDLAVLFIPATLMGLSFPLLSRAYISSTNEVGRGAGRIYGTNVIGGIFGSLASGFLLIPLMGAQTAILSIGLINLLIGAGAVIMSHSAKGFGWTEAGLGLVFIFLFFGVLLSDADIGAGPHTGGEVIYKKEGIAGTVRVIKEKGGRNLTLSVNNYLLATTGDVAVRFGHIPLLLHPAPRDVLAISLGAGITAGAVASAEEVERVDCVEIVPELVETAPLFKESNHHVMSNPKLHLTVWDGRNFVKSSDRKYDVIISDLFQPDSSGVGNLYAREHYVNCLEKLKAGGLMAQWLPLYQLHPEGVRTITATFASVFPHVTLWFGDANAAKPTLMLLGSRERLELDPVRLSHRMATDAVKKDLIEWNDPMSLIGFYLTDREGLKEFIQGARINTDEHPVIEYSAPRHVWSRSGNALENFKTLAGLRTPFTHLSSAVQGPERVRVMEKIDNYFESRTWLFKAGVAHARADFKKEIGLLRKAEEVLGTDPFLGFSYFELGHLYLERGRIKDAVWFLKRATAVSPALPEAHYYLSRAYKMAGREEKAKMEYRLAVEALE